MATVHGDSQLQSEVLENLSDARNYRRWLAGLARPYLGDHPIEIGSGTGDYAEEWIPTARSFTVTEAETDRLKALQVRFADHPTVAVHRLLLGDLLLGDQEEQWREAGHSAAVAFNVLEHIPDHVAAVRGMGALVVPSGAVVLVVPAFPSAMSSFDREIGHQRRYTCRSLNEVLVAAGLHVEMLRYINPIGLLNWYLSVKVLGVTPRNGLALRLFDRTVVPLARALDHLRMPFGQSVFAVARRPA